MAFVMLCRPPNADADDMGKVVLIHRVTKYAARIGMPATPWDDKLFAFVGEVTHQQIMSVEWDQAFFNQVPAQVRVPTNDTAAQLLAQAPAPSHFGPFDANDAGTKLIRTRRTMYVPPAYVGLFLGQELEPVVAYSRLVGVATADGRLDALAPLVDWLALASTHQAQDQGHSVLARNYPSVPLADATLLAHRWSLLTRDLPGLDLSNQNLPGFQQVAIQVGALASEIRQGNQDTRAARAKSAAPKTPDEYFGPRLQVLLRLCQVQSAEQLPPVYSALAASKKKQERSILQHYVDEMTDQLNVFHKVIITPSLAKKLAQIEWPMDDDQNLDHGVHHFHVTYRTPQDQEVLRRLIDSYALVAEHESSATLTDARAFLEADRIDIPKTWSQVRYTLQNMWALSATFLGLAHPNTTAMERALREYQGMEALLETLPPPPGVSMHQLPAYFVRWMQIRWSVWTDMQARSPAAIAPPQYMELFTKVRYNEPWCPHFPPGYLVASTPTPAPAPAPAPTPAPAPAPAPTPAPAPHSDGRSQLGDSSAPSNSRLNNLQWKEQFAPFKAAASRVRDIKARCQQANIALPKGADGRLRCLAFHVKGMCNERCGQRADHKVATAAEDEVLLEWCQQHWNE
ncbi:hypothetical protein [Marinobacter shengliensis]